MSWVDLESDIAEMFGELSVFSRQEQADGFAYYRRGDGGVRYGREMRELEAMYARKVHLATWLERLPPLPAWQPEHARRASPWRLVG